MKLVTYRLSGAEHVGALTADGAVRSRCQMWSCWLPSPAPGRMWSAWA